MHLRNQQRHRVQEDFNVVYSRHYHFGERQQDMKLRLYLCRTPCQKTIKIKNKIE